MVYCAIMSLLNTRCCFWSFFATTWSVTHFHKADNQDTPRIAEHCTTKLFQLFSPFSPVLFPIQFKRSQEQKQKQQVIPILCQVPGTPLANLPRGTQTWQLPCLSRQAPRSEACGTERGTLCPCVQFRAVLIPVPVSCTYTRHISRFASYS